VRSVRPATVVKIGQGRLPGEDLVTKELSDLARGIGLIERERLGSCFREIEPQLYRFPAVDVPDFRRAVEAFLNS